MCIRDSGKMERVVAFAIANIAATLSKLSYDACLYNSQNFGFIKLPDEYTTGSSIMPVSYTHLDVYKRQSLYRRGYEGILCVVYGF